MLGVAAGLSDSGVVLFWDTNWFSFARTSRTWRSPRHPGLPRSALAESYTAESRKKRTDGNETFIEGEISGGATIGIPTSSEYGRR